MFAKFLAISPQGKGVLFLLLLISVPFWLITFEEAVFPLLAVLRKALGRQGRVREIEKSWNEFGE